MQINGTDTLVNRVVVALPRQSGDLSITIRALPLGWSRQFAEMVPAAPAPLKPTGVMTNAGAKLEPDFDDVEWRKAFKERNDLSTFFMLFLVLSQAPEVKLATASVACVDDIRAFRAELEQSGLSDGDINRINAAIMLVSNLADQEVATRKAGF